jgi:hypothetical protein
VAQANTTAAFVDLVERYVAERIPQRIDGIADHAHGTYSEKAVRPAILDLVGRAGGQA